MITFKNMLFLFNTLSIISLYVSSIITFVNISKDYNGTNFIVGTYILFNYSGLYLLYLSFTLFLIGMWVCREWLNAVGDQDNDPSMIVIDEAAGLSLTLAFAEMSLISVFLGFALFRLLDIAKPWPISWLEKRFSGAFGIMIDDMVAGLLAGIILFFFQIYG